MTNQKYFLVYHFFYQIRGTVICHFRHLFDKSQTNKYLSSFCRVILPLLRLQYSFHTKTMQDEIKPLLPRKILQEDYDIVCSFSNLLNGELSFKHQIVHRKLGLIFHLSRVVPKTTSICLAERLQKSIVVHDNLNLAVQAIYWDR